MSESNQNFGFSSPKRKLWLVSCLSSNSRFGGLSEWAEPIQLRSLKRFSYWTVSPIRILRMGEQRTWRILRPPFEEAPSGSTWNTRSGGWLHWNERNSETCPASRSAGMAASVMAATETELKGASLAQWQQSNICLSCTRLVLKWKSKISWIQVLFRSG